MADLGTGRLGNLENVRLLGPGGEFCLIPPDVADRYTAGDRLLLLPDGSVLHLPAAQVAIAGDAVTRAYDAFRQLSRIGQEAITEFYERFARSLEEDHIWSQIAAANREDVREAQSAGRSTTRLAVNDKMRRAMIEGLLGWSTSLSPIGRVLETTRHDGWMVEQVVGPLGIVGFVFEGRPNVFADATGVLRTGNSTVMRIGRDALRTAEAIVETALSPSLRSAGLPEATVSLIRSREHSAGWALFSDTRLSLAVARGSGRAVRQLGAVARQAGVPASLHGTGGAWMAADATAEDERLFRAIYHSLDRKVCNTLNTFVVYGERAEEQLAVLLRALGALHERDGHNFRIHSTPRARPYLPQSLFETETDVFTAEGVQKAPIAEPLEEAELGREWEWEQTPEISIAVAENLDETIDLFNKYSPQFTASLISANQAAQHQFYESTNAPFVGDGFTRWVDGQYALNRPELGLSNWQNGRLLGRSGILSGDGIYTVRMRMTQTDPGVHR